MHHMLCTPLMIYLRLNCVMVGSDVIISHSILQGSSVHRLSYQDHDLLRNTLLTRPPPTALTAGWRRTTWRVPTRPPPTALTAGWRRTTWLVPTRPPPYGSHRWLAADDMAGPYTPPPYGSHRWLAADDMAGPYTPPPYGSHRWLAADDMAGPYAPPPYSGSAKFKVVDVVEEHDKKDVAGSSYTAKAENVFFLESRHTDKSGRHRITTTASGPKWEQHVKNYLPIENVY
ncbi:hypothetical protein Naga_100002g71 [Nannochloropsis gaditana]|uniref:Uncharacterized protein n=1 Tax=Nannochloropsis gaditana TaxID=72520 RepID=W7U7E8_9STRA|nr:hypothetical protein Naga_100002g71 [Nannochloropsis gaditana]